MSDEFPVESFREAAIHMRRPFAAPAVKFKVQATFSGNKGALIVSYIDARLVVERLNLIVPHLWCDSYVPLDGKFLRCDLTVDGITRSDVGEGAGKGGYSDALKRAAVKFGVGVSLYAIPQVNVFANEKKWLELRGSGQKQTLVITEAGEAALRSGYSKWLAEHGEPSFGKVLDHGDVEGAVGDPDAPGDAPDAGEDEPIRQLAEGEEADRLRTIAAEYYSDLVGIVGRSAYPPAEFQAGLASHGHSVEALDEFCLGLRGRLDEAAAGAKRDRERSAA